MLKNTTFNAKLSNNTECQQTRVSMQIPVDTKVSAEWITFNRINLELRQQLLFTKLIGILRLRVINKIECPRESLEYPDSKILLYL